jgi:hypothetical protein
VIAYKIAAARRRFGDGPSQLAKYRGNASNKASSNFSGNIN